MKVGIICCFSSVLRKRLLVLSVVRMSRGLEEASELGDRTGWDWPGGWSHTLQGLRGLRNRFGFDRNSRGGLGEGWTGTSAAPGRQRQEAGLKGAQE